MKNDDLTIYIHDATESDAAKILEIQKLAFRGQAVLYDDFTLPPLTQTLEELIQDFIGKMLIHAVENKFSCVRRYELFTGYKSEKNLALYGKLGYCKFLEKPQGDNVTLICMEKRKA